ncbi:hypothetical protein HYU22_04745 [Candidatus Woesearchaeota archaeon]|nr:hypothetical protein [Candidatus Woesearchaeota archaeon]
MREMLVGMKNPFSKTGYYDRMTHAFWDCLGETTFRPSGELLLSLYCSRVSPLRAEDSSLVDIVEGIKQGNISISEFPHALFDRWDITVHEPGSLYSEAKDEPVYAGRFTLTDRGLQNAGFYSQENSAWIQGWGYPCIDTLLMSPAVERDGSFFQREIFAYKKMSDDLSNKLKIEKRVTKNISYLLRAFSEITAQFHEGLYNEDQEPYYFGEATEAAIAVGEAMTKRPSKLRFQRLFSGNFTSGTN